jgi:diaminohydroxyphosphoribosylaminopyrimidine deaminase/5-amino-6-(5-phosphoribosylamino)uracil reductase
MATSSRIPPPSADAYGLDAARIRDCVERLGRPYVRLKAAATLDGKIATRDGESQWITGEAARALGRKLRGVADGVLVGIGTALADDPRLTVRDESTGDGAAGKRAAPEPARIVLDSTARLPVDARCLAADGARRIVVVGNAAPRERTEALRAFGVEIVALPAPRPEPGAFLPALLSLGMRSLLVEGGARVHASLIAHRAADELWLFLSGSVMGDGAAPAWCGDLAGEAQPLRRGLAGLPRLRLLPPLWLEGGDLLVRGDFENPDSP